MPLGELYRTLGQSRVDQNYTACRDSWDRHGLSHGSIRLCPSTTQVTKLLSLAIARLTQGKEQVGHS